MSNANKALVYIIAGSKSGKVNDADKGEYYTYDAVVDGKITTIDVKSDVAVNSDILASKLTTNSKDVVTGITEYGTTGDDKMISGTGTKKTTDGTVGLSNTYYTYSDDVVVFRIEDNDFKAASVTSIRDDSNDTFKAVVKDGEVIAIFITVKAGNPDASEGEAAVSSQEELEAALSDGATSITLYDGEYTFDAFDNLTDDLTIVGDGNVEVSNLDVKGSGNLTISGVDFVVDGGYGLNLRHGYTGDVTIEDCSFEARYGIYVDAAGTITVRNCTFEVTVCPMGWSNADKVVFEDNTIVGTPERPYLENFDKDTTVDTDYALAPEKD